MTTIERYLGVQGIALKCLDRSLIGGPSEILNRAGGVEGVMSSVFEHSMISSGMFTVKPPRALYCGLFMHRSKQTEQEYPKQKRNSPNPGTTFPPPRGPVLPTALPESRNLPV